MVKSEADQHHPSAEEQVPPQVTEKSTDKAAPMETTTAEAAGQPKETTAKVEEIAASDNTQLEAV